MVYEMVLQRSDESQDIQSQERQEHLRSPISEAMRIVSSDRISDILSPHTGDMLLQIIQNLS